MNKLYHLRLAKFLIIAVISVLFVSSGFGQSLVTRDDFLCYDTTKEFYDWANWPSIAIDSEGNLFVSNYQLAPPPCYIDCSKMFLTRFDKYGYQAAPTIQFLPDTVSEDTIWRPTGFTPAYCNDDYVFIPYHVSRIGSDDKQNLITFDINQDFTFEKVCVDCETEYLSYKGISSRGAISNTGRAITTWPSFPDENHGADSVFLKFYDISNKTLSPMINCSQITPPLNQIDGVHDYNIDLFPFAGVADNGSFVSVWCGEYGSLSHVFYLLYDSTGSPLFDTIKIADCDEGFMPSGYCQSDYTRAVDVIMEPDGDFYLTWCGWSYEDGEVNFAFGERIYIRGFNANGTPKYDPVCVTDTDSLYMWYGGWMVPFISCDSSGNVLITWSDSRFYPESNSNGLKFDVFAQKVDPNGNLVGPNFRINNTHGTAGVQGINHENDMNDAGQAVIIWRYILQDLTIFAQLMPYESIGEFVPGDINYDLEGNISDLTAYVDYMFLGAKNTFWPRDLIDLNGDGENGNISDLTYLVEYFFAGGDAPHTPFSGIRPEFTW